MKRPPETLRTIAVAFECTAEGFLPLKMQCLLQQGYTTNSDQDVCNHQRAMLHMKSTCPLGPVLSSLLSCNCGAPALVEALAVLSSFFRYF